MYPARKYCQTPDTAKKDDNGGENNDGSEGGDDDTDYNYDTW